MRASGASRPLRRRTVLAGASALALGGAAGCGGGSSSGRRRLRFLSLAWQPESVAANKRLVAQWNKANPDVPVDYQQGSWDTVHDQLVTSFEGGEAPDIVHDASDDLSDFANGGYLRALDDLLPEEFLAGLPEPVRAMGTWGGRLYGVPFLQEPRVLIANRRLLERAGIRLPTTERPWSWEEFESAAEELSGGTGSRRRYGVAWPLKEPVSVTLNLSLGFGGKWLYESGAGSGSGDAVRFSAEREGRLPSLIHRQVHRSRTAPEVALGMGGSDSLPGFFDGRYGMLPLGFSYRQQVAQQAPDGFDWTVLPAPAGPEGQVQGVSPQTLSVSHQCGRPREAAGFIAFFLGTSAMADLAAGDWLLPCVPAAAEELPSGPKAEALGWPTGIAMMEHLRAAPSQRVKGYPEWKDKIATPTFQEYYAGRMSLGEMAARVVDDGNNILERYR